jgi:hypothetical protein
MSRIDIEDFKTFFEKFTEMCSITLYNMNNGQDPSQEGWDIMEQVHELFWNGKIVLYKTILEENTPNMVQGGLFDDKKADAK